MTVSCLQLIFCLNTACLGLLSFHWRELIILQQEIQPTIFKSSHYKSQKSCFEASYGHFNCGHSFHSTMAPQSICVLLDHSFKLWLELPKSACSLKSDSKNDIVGSYMSSPYGFHIQFSHFMSEKMLIFFPPTCKHSLWSESQAGFFLPLASLSVIKILQAEF